MPEGPPLGPSGGVAAVLPLGGPNALIVLGRGTVYRTDDGGQTWAAVGRAPEINESRYAGSAALDPDGRLYVGLSAQGLEDGWVWRTAEPVLTAAVTTEAEPMKPPVVIGPSGGAFPFTVTLTNTTAQPQTVQAWSAVTGPLTRSLVLGPVTVTLPAGATATRTLTQQVPGNAPAGTYTYAVRVGDYPGVVLSSAAFEVTKQEAEGLAGEAALEGWSVSGWEETAAGTLAEDVGLAVSPNPFRGAAAVTLALGAPAEAVTVALYDVLGRRVAVLARGRLDGGAHTFALDGSVLPAGVYVVRVALGGASGAGPAVAARTVTLLR
jgi:hypothetical protein